MFRVRRRRLGVECLSERVVPAAITYTGAAATPDVTLGTNWAGGVAPGPNDDAVFPANPAQDPWVPQGKLADWGTVTLPVGFTELAITGQLDVHGGTMAGGAIVFHYTYPAKPANEFDDRFVGPPLPPKVELNGSFNIEDDPFSWNAGRIGDGTGLGTVGVAFDGRLLANSFAVGFNYCNVTISTDGRFTLGTFGLQNNIDTTRSMITVEGNGEMNFINSATGDGEKGGLSGGGSVYLTNGFITCSTVDAEGWMAFDSVRLYMSGGDYQVDPGCFVKHTAADVAFPQDVLQTGGTVHLHGKLGASLWLNDFGDFRFELAEHPTFVGTLKLDDPAACLSFAVNGNKSKIAGSLIINAGTINMPLASSAMQPILWVTQTITFGEGAFLNWFIAPLETPPASGEAEFLQCSDTFTGDLGLLQFTRTLVVQAYGGLWHWKI